MNCQGETWPTGAMRPHQCSRKGTVCENGAYFCKTHSPEGERKRKEKQAERDRERDAEWEVMKTESKRVTALLEALSHLGITTADELYRRVRGI